MKDMIYIPGGSFVMGAADKEREESELTHVTLSPYYISRNLVTVAEYRLAVEAGACSVPKMVFRDNYAAFNWGAEDRDNHPINGVTWAQAAEYCEWVGGRLPTEAEWEYAARGSDGRIYPWGNEAPGNQVAWDGEGNDVGAYFRHGTSPVGSHPAGASPFGILDMAGNVQEWVGDWHEIQLPRGKVKDPKGPPTGTVRVLRGGSWNEIAPERLRAGYRSGDLPNESNDDFGFRCVRAKAP